MLKDIASVEGKACAKGGMFGSGVQEYEVKDSEGRRTRLYVPVGDLKERGLTKRYDHFKRAEEWLNTDEGKEYLKKLHPKVFGQKTEDPALQR